MFCDNNSELYINYNILPTDQIIQYSGDPLKDFAGIRFLDRFVFKNPKKRTEKDLEGEGDVKKVKGSHPKFAVRKNYMAKGINYIFFYLLCFLLQG